MKLLLITLLTLATTLVAQAQSNDFQHDEDFLPNLVSMYAATSASTFEASRFETQPEFKEFTYVVVVNKANEGSDKQTLKMYERGILVLETKVSTGREQQEGGNVAGHKPTRTYFSTTPAGFFYPQTFEEKHYSNLWKTWMPFSVFFNGGIALHQVPAGSEFRLGTRASGGCVRIAAEQAPKIFAMIKAAGKGLVPLFSRDGSMAKDRKGNVIRKVNYKTLIIVQNKMI